MRAESGSSPALGSQTERGAAGTPLREAIVQVFATYLKEHHAERGAVSINDAFQQRFHVPLPDALNDSHELVIVAASLDPSTERIVGYLAAEYGVHINALFSRVFKDEEREYLAAPGCASRSEHRRSADDRGVALHGRPLVPRLHLRRVVSSWPRASHGATEPDSPRSRAIPQAFDALPPMCRSLDCAAESSYTIARMRYETILSPEAVEDLRGLKAHVRAEVRDAMEEHLRHAPTRESKSRIKRLRGLSQPQYRLRIGEVRVFYDVVEGNVEVLAIVAKSEAEGWLARMGEP